MPRGDGTGPLGRGCKCGSGLRRRNTSCFATLSDEEKKKVLISQRDELNKRISELE